MNTIKIQHPNKPLMVAHRGVSGLEQENTHAAFVAAGNRSYFGVETDLYKTADGFYVTIHDDRTGRVAIDDLVVEQSTYETLRKLILKQKNGVKGRTDVLIPNLEEYIGICKHYEKIAVLELKSNFSPEEIREICGIIEKLDYLPNVIFISFNFDNLLRVKEIYPDHPVQFLLCDWEDTWIEKLTANHMDLDIAYPAVNPEMVKACHEAGIKVNCWTVDSPETAQYVMDCGVDYITSNILE